VPESRPFADHSVDPHVRGFLHTPDTPNGNGLVLTHGAGSNANSPLLIALGETFSSAGFTVLRIDLPYRQVRSWGPPGPGDAARDRAGLRNAITSLRKTLDSSKGAPFKPDSGLSGDFPSKQSKWVAPSLSRSLRQDGSSQSETSEVAPSNTKFVGWGSIFLGGHSYGGRQSSMLCAELAENERDLVAGLLLLSYPLHPPRKPEQQRTQHLPNLHTPTLFVHGTRDPFGSITEIEQAIKMIPAKTKLIAIDGAGHDLAFKGKSKEKELPAQIFSEFAHFFGLSS
jgi:uncharacterized protein